MSDAVPLRKLLALMSSLALVLVGILALPATAFAAAAPALGASISASSPTRLAVAVTGENYANTSPGVYVALGESGLGRASNPAAFVTSVWVKHTSISPDGDFAATLELDASGIAKLDSGKSYAIYSMKAHGVDDPTQFVEQRLPIDFASLVEASAAPSVSVSRTSVPAQGPTVVTVRGIGFDPALATGKYPPLFGKASGVYVAFGKFAEAWRPSTGATSAARKTADQRWAVLAADLATVGGAAAGAIELKPDGSFSAELTIDRAAADRAAIAESLVNYGIYTYPGGGAAAPSYETYTPITFESTDEETPEPKPEPKPKPEVKPVAPKPRVAAGYLRWGVNTSFRDYVQGPIANGTISVGAGAVRAGSDYRFGQAATSADARGIGQTSYRGALSFAGHHGALALTLSAPRVTVESAARGSLSMVVDGSRRTIATLDLARASRSASAGAVTFARAPVTLTAAGASAFNGFYSAGAAMDPLTFVIGSVAKAGTSVMTTVASARSGRWLPPGTPPATRGLQVEFEDAGRVAAGQQLRASATGFAANEKGIKVVVYSTPIVLAKTVVADASGRASWTGLLPASLEAGTHTLTFQGSVSRGQQFTIAAAVDTDTVAECRASDASFDWGVKESFRAYLSGSLADGGWKTSGNASYQTPTFTFVDGAGGFDQTKFAGEVAFDGDITFSGHNGALTVKLADPVLKLVDKHSGYLLFDTTAGDMAAAMAGDASAKTVAAAPVVELDLDAATVTAGADGSTRVEGARTVLTAQGSDAFSNYQAGAEFDRLDFTISSDPDCAAAAAPASADTKTAAEPAQLAATAASEDANWLPWGIAALVAAFLLAGAVMVRRRARAA